MMNRQLIIRGVAISVAAIGVSVFAAGEFLGDGRGLPPTGAVSGGAPDVLGASLTGGTNSAAKPDDSMDVTWDFAARDTAPFTIAAPDVQTDILPDLVLIEQDAGPAPSLCSPDMSARPAIDGLIDLRLSAPCNMGERVVISHGDLAFAVTLDETGSYSAYIPALAEQASVEAFLEDDSTLQATTLVPDFADHARMVVQWTGPDAISLHAFHRNAGYGDDGHMHAANPFDPALEEAFLVTLGDPIVPEPMLAQVYSTPLTSATDTRLQLEVAATPATCGMDLTALIMPTHGPDAGNVRALNVAVPACGGDGGFVLIDLPFDVLAADQVALSLE